MIGTVPVEILNYPANFTVDKAPDWQSADFSFWTRFPFLNSTTIIPVIQDHGAASSFNISPSAETNTIRIMFNTVSNLVFRPKSVL